MRALTSLSTHRHRLTRSFESTLKQLRQLQKERRSEELAHLWKASRLSPSLNTKDFPTIHPKMASFLQKKMSRRSSTTNSATTTPSWPTTTAKKTAKKTRRTTKTSSTGL